LKSVADAGTSIRGDEKEDAASVKTMRTIVTHDLIPLEMLIRNNTRESVTLSFSVTCRDVAGENCLGGDKATVLWAGMVAQLYPLLVY
jgi:hypothetical protein